MSANAPSEPICILFLSADPRDTLDTNREFRRVYEAVQKQPHIRILSRDHVYAGDLQRILRQDVPHIIHFSGHGTNQRGDLVTQHPQGGTQTMPLEALAEMMKALKGQVPTRLVVLNACWTLPRAAQLLDGVEAVVGMTGEIEDTSAAAFAEGFYLDLCSGGTLETALVAGRAQLKALGGGDDVTPQYLIRKGLAPTQIVLQGLHRTAPPSGRPIHKDKRVELFIEKVRAIWIDGVLSNTVRHHGLSPDMIIDGLSSDHTRQNAEANISHYFDESGGRLLILGSEGSGKTVLLLKLLDILTRQPDHVFFPVLFTLSSWGIKQEPLEDWLVERLNFEYGVPKKLARHWVKDDRLVVLLDGLDEVDPSCRSGCVKAINAYLDINPIRKLVLCSRYHGEKLPTFDPYTAGESLDFVRQLKLQAVAHLQDLSDEQIDSQITPFPVLSNLRHRESYVAELMKKPFLLHAILYCYKDGVVGQCLSLADRLNHLLSTYVHHRYIEFRITPEKEMLNYWLSSLARLLLKEKGITLFHIESLQPLMLNQTRGLRLYKGLVWFYFGSLQGMVLATVILSVTIATGLPFDFGVNSLFGLAFPRLLPLFFVLNSGKSTAGALTVGLALGRVISIFSMIILTSISIHTPIYLGHTASALMGLTAGLLVGLALFYWGTVNSARIVNKNDLLMIRPVEEIRNMPLFTTIVRTLFRGLAESENTEAIGGVIPQKSEPNQGIKRSLKNALILGIIFATFASTVSVPIMLVGQVIVKRLLETPEVESSQLIVAVIMIFVGSYIYIFLGGGGREVVKHYILRVFLRIYRVLPLRVERFLYLCVKANLVTSVGGGFMFRHSHLLNYYAKLVVHR